MEQLARQHTNVSMSDEMIASTARHVTGQDYSFVDRMVQDLGPNFRLAIVVVYRR